MYFYMLTLPDIYMSNTSHITTYPMRRKYQKYICGVVGAEKNTAAPYKKSLRFQKKCGE